MNKTVCLSMIVKNEAHVIERCLKSVADLVDYYLIVDTGSTDNTIEVIEAFIKSHGGKGKVLSREWKDFGTNRTEALEIARTEFDVCPDYALVMDADDILEIKDLSKVKSLLGFSDAYELPIISGKWRWNRCHFFRLSKPFIYRDTLHEYATCSEHFSKMLMPSVEYICIGGGGRHSDPNLVDHEIALLRKQVEQDGANGRALYLLGQTYYFNNRIEEAIKTFEERLFQNFGWNEERFLSAFWLGEIYEAKNDWEKAEFFFKQAHNLNKKRAEPLEKLARHYRLSEAEGWEKLSYEFSLKGSKINPDPYALFLNKNVHDYKIIEELSLSAYAMGHLHESLEACRKILKSNATPICCQERTKELLELVRDKLIGNNHYPKDLVELNRPNFRVVISVTTLPSRYELLERVLESIHSQSLQADAIYICLPEFSDREKCEYLTPDFLTEKDRILKSDKDYGPATKLIPTLLKETNPNTLIVTIDDDIIYHPYWLQRIVNQALLYPDSAIGFAAWNVKSNNKSPYDFVYEEHSDFPSGKLVNVLEGYRGVAYRRKFFDDSIANYDDYPNESKFQDDVWFSGKLALKNIPKRIVHFRSDRRLTITEVWNEMWIGMTSYNPLSSLSNFSEISKITANCFENQVPGIWEKELSEKNV